MNETPFAELAQLGERLEQTTKRKELAALVAEFLLTLSPDEIPPAVRLIIGQVFAEWDGRALNLSSKAVSAVIDTQIEATDRQRREIYAQAVDPGEATRMLFEQFRREPPADPPWPCSRSSRSWNRSPKRRARARARARQNYSQVC